MLVATDGNRWGAHASPACFGYAATVAALSAYRAYPRVRESACTTDCCPIKTDQPEFSRAHPLISIDLQWQFFYGMNDQSAKYRALDALKIMAATALISPAAEIASRWIHGYHHYCYCRGNSQVASEAPEACRRAAEHHGLQAVESRMRLSQLQSDFPAKLTNAPLELQDMLARSPRMVAGHVQFYHRRG